MIWSKRKARAEAFFAPCLRGRLALHRTSFRAGYDLAARAWITFEGHTIWECRTPRVDPEEAEPFGPPRDSNDETRLAPSDFDAGVAAYPDLSIDDALSSPLVLARALSLLDARTGKRRLLACDPNGFAHSVERTMFALRLRAEGLRLTDPRPLSSF